MYLLPDVAEDPADLIYSGAHDQVVQERGGAHVAFEKRRMASLASSANNPLTAELLAIRIACRLALTYGWQNAIVESGCKVAI
nr:hypothetical protein CTI12_AA306500 [Tanacetum cinerariifolium]